MKMTAAEQDEFLGKFAEVLERQRQGATQIEAAPEGSVVPFVKDHYGGIAAGLSIAIRLLKEYRPYGIAIE